MPRFNAISVAGAHFRDAGANAAQEMAFTLMDGITYCDEVMARGRMTIDEFAPQVSFFFYTHGDFFEEIAKYRAGRRRWARIVRERYGAQDDRSCMFRVGCVAGGASLYAPQAHNNIVRVAYEALASVLGGVQSMFTAAWDEPFALPSEDSATLALRTQQVLAYETGVARVADPLGGSYYVEALTDEMEARVVEIMDDLERRGGMVKAVEDGYLQRLISEEAFRVQQAITSGDRQIVGVNRYAVRRGAARGRGLRDGREGPAPPARAAGRGEAVALGCRGPRRRWARCGAAAARDDDNLMPRLIDCAKAYCTVGEMVDVLKDEWGEFQQPAVFWGWSDMAVRVLVAKPGLDGHDRGAKLVARTLRDAGFEVIYTGIRQRPESIASLAVQEDVQIVGLSILSGAHVALTQKTADALRAAGADDVVLVVGGTIPQRDVPRLEAAGAAAVYPTGTPLEDLVESMRELGGGERTMSMMSTITVEKLGKVGPRGRGRRPRPPARRRLAAGVVSRDTRGQRRPRVSRPPRRRRDAGGLHPEAGQARAVPLAPGSPRCSRP